MRLLHLLAPILVLIIGAGAPAAEAQEGAQVVRTLVIKNNQVVIDGKPIGQDALPPNMSLDGISISYSFVGVDIPVITLGSSLFAVEEGQLRPLESREAYDSVLTEQKKILDMGEANGWIVDYDRGEYYTFQGERLEAEDAVPRLLDEANALYLEDLQQQNQHLFSRLTREHELETEADYLAHAARRSTTNQARAQHIAELTRKLNEIFDLKQQNRRDEIAQFEAELNELRRRLEQREELREKIIEQRVARLTGGGN